MINPALSAPSPNLIMKPGTTPADLHRIPDATHASSRPRREPETEDLTDYCSRPSCRNPFQRAAGPGRRQAFCTDFCRRTAQNELRRARSRLTHYEGVVQKLFVSRPIPFRYVRTH